MDSYDGWVARHSRAFGMVKPADLEMLGEWVAVFRQQGFTPAELDAATTHLIGREAVQFRTQQLAVIQRFIGNQRSRPPEPTGDLRGVCTRCEGVGLVVVPHPRFVVGGIWQPPYPRAAVTCPCDLGRWHAGRINTDTGYGRGERPPIMSFENYIRRVPNWQSLMEERQQQQVAQARATERAGSLDKLLGSIMAKAQARAVA